jgi:hypothetical protein
MQNKYFGDIHDFYKYYILKRISEHFSLGINWCLVQDDKSKDGNKKLSVKENNKDQKLFGILNKFKNRDVSNIKPYFPPKTKYYNELHQEYHLKNIYTKNSFEKLSKQDIVFFDPDNGLEVLSTNNKNKFKYLSYDTLEIFWNNGNSIIVYQHMSRDKKSLENKIKKITELLNCYKIGNINIVRNKFVDYIFIIQKKHYLLHDIIADFVNKNNEYKIIEI